jgi:hypothetical protein
MLAAILTGLLGAAAAPAMAAQVPPPATDHARLAACLRQARTDSAGAITTADTWLSAKDGAERADALQCLGFAYSRSGDWAAAEQAFVAARDALPADARAQRASLASMAGNAALADDRPEAALVLLDMAIADAAGSGLTELSGEAEIDRARALVALGQSEPAATALANARRDAPQSADAWLLSATLARRTGNLGSAQDFIETAASLNPVSLAIGLEAGLIAALAGQLDAARKSWQSVVDADPSSAQAESAKRYLEQLEPS